MDIESLKLHIKSFTTDQYNWNKLKKIVSLSQLSKAAVLVALTVNFENEVEVWLTKRSQTVTNYKGHVCFPGGMYEKDYDKNEIDTALRESYEEIGLEQSSVDILGTFLPYINNRNVLITPVIGFIDYTFKPKTNSEVEFAFKIVLSRFLKKYNYKKIQFQHPENNSIVFFHSFYDIVNKNEKITTFGITATRLVDIAVVVLKKAPEFDLSYNVHQPLLKQMQFLKSISEKCPNKKTLGKL